MGYGIIFFWLAVLPVWAGFLFPAGEHTKTLSLRWLMGQFLLWALFQPVAVCMILRETSLTKLVGVYTVAALFVGLLGLLRGIVMWKAGDKPAKFTPSMWTTKEKWLAGLFAVLWLVQMAALLFLAVNDGDDAFYMAVANVAESADSMYVANVYAFGNTGLNYRYALAPFPIWIAFLSRISGVHTLVLGHIILGMMLVTMSYVIYDQAGRVLFGTDRAGRLLFLCMTGLLVIWGNTSSHTAESFLLLRSRQGKALVAGIVFPATMYLLLRLGRALADKQKVTLEYFVFAACVILAGCLGSTLGGALVILLFSSGFFFLVLGYKAWRLLPLGICSVLPGVVFAVLYLLH